MGRKNKGGKSRPPEEGGRPPKLPAVDKAEEEEGDRLFLETMGRMSKVPSKDRLLEEMEKNAAARQPAKASGPAGAVHQLDLHHSTLPEARGRVDGLLGNLVAAIRGPVTVKIITGKGRHSGPGGGVLASEIHRYVSQKYASYIVSIEPSPSDVVVGELPIRGHFHVTLGPSTKLR